MATVVRRYTLTNPLENPSSGIGPAFLSNETIPITCDMYLDNTVTNYAEDSDQYMSFEGYTFETELSDPPSPSIAVDFLTQFPIIVNRSYTFVSGADNGEYYIGGAYGASSTDANLTNASTTVTFGTANSPYGAYAFIVAGGAGSASGGAGTVEIEVSGTSISDTGTRTASDTEIIVADITTLVLDGYLQTTRKWIGQVTWTLQNSGGGTHTTFSSDFNYGLASVEDFRDTEFRPLELRVTGYAGASDSGFNIQLYDHNNSGWTYAATGFDSGNTPIADFESEYGAESNIVTDQQFSWTRDGINTLIRGDLGEGVIIKITTSVNSSVRYLNANLVALVNPDS